MEESPLTEGRFTRRSATFIGSFTLAARVVERIGAFGQIALVASIYGSGFVADRYFIASIVPLIIGAVAGEAFSANILPALVRSRTERSSLIAAGFWLALGAVLVVTACYLVVATIVVRSAAPAGSSDLGVWYAFAPIGPLLGLSGYLSGVLTYLERYVWPPFRTALATVGGFVLMAIVLLFTHSLTAVAAAVSAGYAVSFVALIWEIRRATGRGALGIPAAPALSEAAGLRGGLAAPVVGGLLGGQVFVLLERALASTIGVGAVASLSYARGVAFTPLIVAQSIALGIYPGMLRAFEAQSMEHVRSSFVRGLRLTLFLALAMAAFFALFGRETVALLFERGAFHASAANDVGSILSAFAPALVGSMLMVFVARIYYAIDYFRAVVWVQLLALVVYAIVALPLRAAWGTTGLAIAFGIAELSGAVFGVVIASRRIGLGVRKAFSGAVVPALARAGFVAAVLAVVRITFTPRAAGGSSDLRFGVGFVIGAALGVAVLWQAAWPELAPVKRRLRALVPSRPRA